MKKLLLSTLAVGLLAASAIAYAQTAVPQAVTISPTLDRIAIIPNGQASAQSTFASPSQITVTKGYYKSIPAAAFTFTFATNQAIAAFDPAGTLATGTVTLATNPSDGSEQCVFTTAAITALTVSAGTGATISDAVTTLAANAKVCYLYGSSNAVWNRSQ